uniref:ATP synthase F0 subunit 8 n=1 Tax=Neoscona multiplicans TaxID=1112442 RepID=A0A5B7M119_9ARAC|nr:ATP synthase F0 subunit 8 [Neoscona multiplicans]QCF46300.1 ATP synthase F0 subunit 8 [Neoscona multiplicans]
MPQLMPLNWLFSSMMVLLIVVSAGVMYSVNMYNSDVDMLMGEMKKSMNYWCW